MKTDELVAIFTEKFKLNGFKVVGMDDNDILWGSKKDNFGVTWNIKNNNIEFFQYGHKIGFICNESLERGIYDINPNSFDDIVSEMIVSLKGNEDIKDQLGKLMSTYISSENYEDVVYIRDLMKLIYTD